MGGGGWGESTFEHVREVMAIEQSHPPSHNIRKRKKKKETKEQKTENTSPQGQQGNKATSDNKRNFISKIEVLGRCPMFQNPGFIQTNKQTSKQANKQTAPSNVDRRGQLEGQHCPRHRKQFWLKVCFWNLQCFLSPRPQAQGRIPRPTPPLPGEARLRQRRPRPRPRPRLKQGGRQTLP